MRASCKFISIFEAAQQTNPWADEAEYNAAIVAALVENQIDVIAITDHYRVKDSVALLRAVQRAGIFVFQGFEAKTDDGVHWLCLFEPSVAVDTLERYIGKCGVADAHEPSPMGTITSQELLSEVKTWGGICVAAHAAADGMGLLKKLSGQTRAKLWKSKDLLAATLREAISPARSRGGPTFE